MDMVGGIQYIDNKLGGHSPKHGGQKRVKKYQDEDAVDEIHARADNSDSSGEYDTRVGRKLDTTA